MLFLGWMVHRGDEGWVEEKREMMVVITELNAVSFFGWESFLNLLLVDVFLRFYRERMF